METPLDITNSCPNVLQGISAQMLLLLINTLMAEKCKLRTEHLYPKNYAQYLKDDVEFDFIVVGAGSAGSVVASRLSEVTSWKILLVEAGGYPSGISEIPVMSFHLKGTEEDWQYLMQPSKSYCTGLKDQVCPCPRGKGLGGTSLINAMIYLRSTRQDHDKWVEAGNNGWDYESVLKHYKKFENMQGNQVDDYYGKGGDLNITRNTLYSPFETRLQNAYIEIGFQGHPKDNPLGYYKDVRTISEGTRQSSAKAFLTKENQKNLFLIINAQVGKLLFDEKETTVTGIEIKVNKKIRRIKARYEVILSAGSINSPQILMNSGIGPKEHLNKLGIKVVRDLKVGENLQDHLLFPAFFVGLKSKDLGPKPLTAKLDDVYQYFMHKKGRLSCMDDLGSSYIKTKNISGNADVLIHHVFFHQQDEEALLTYLKDFMLPEKIITDVLQHNRNSAILSVMLVVLNPESKGCIRLRNREPYSKPLITPNLLSDEFNKDIEVIIDAIKVALKLIETESLSLYSPKLVELDLQNCGAFSSESEKFWECTVRSIASTLFHPVGTCKMGPQSDPTAVVDPRLKVHGIEGVRVIDGSIMPTITSCNTNAPIMMIGEQGAAFIKNDWLNKF